MGSGTSGNSYVHNPNAAKVGGATIHPEFCLPYPLHDEIIARFGEWPPEGETNGDKLVRAVDIATEYVLAERKPAVAFVWFSEPDKSQHAHGVGAEVSTRALREADEQFGRLLTWLSDAGMDAGTDILVISDHGYSTITETIDIEALVHAAGFPPGDRAGRRDGSHQRRLRALLRPRQRYGNGGQACVMAHGSALVRCAGRVRCRRADRGHAARISDWN